MPNQRWITKNGRHVRIRTRGDAIIERVVEGAMEKAVLPDPLSVAIKLANTNWDRIVDLLTNLVSDQDKFLKEMKRDENVQIIRSVLESFLDLTENSRRQSLSSNRHKTGG